MKIVLASNNQKKIKEMRALLEPLSPFVEGGIELLSLKDIGYEGDIEENGLTFEENAMTKASVPAKMGYYGLADDSGLMVDALDGRPGIYSARYAGDHGNDEKNNEKLLFELEKIKDEERTARFVSVLAMAIPEGGDEKFRFTVRGECEGTILREYRGAKGFGYDPLFYYAPLGKTFAELSEEEKNKVSHRARAFEKLSKKLKEIL